MQEKLNKFLKKENIMTYEKFCETDESDKYALSEEEEIYYTGLSKEEKNYKVGDIVYVENYKYKSGANGKKHSFVIIEEGQAISIDYFGFLISSKLEKSKFPYNIIINKNNTNNLFKNSIVKCDDLIAISEKDIKFKIGEVKVRELEKFKKIYNKYQKDNL